MSFITVSLIVFACVFGGAMLGMLLHSVLPNHHLSSESKDIVKLGMGMVATMSALVLGLLVASAKGAYEAQRAELTQMADLAAQLKMERIFYLNLGEPFLSRRPGDAPFALLADKSTCIHGVLPTKRLRKRVARM